MIKTQRQSVSTCTTLPSIFSLVDSIKSTQYWHFSRVATVISARHLSCSQVVQCERPVVTPALPRRTYSAMAPS